MPHSRTLPTPSYPNPKGVTFYGAATIAAPAAQIWSTLLDLPSYHEWNTFTPDPTPTLPPPDIKPGLELHFTAYLKPNDKKGKEMHVRITRLMQGKQLCWTSLGYPHWALRGERVMEIRDFGDGLCEFRTFETMEGILVSAVKWTVGRTLDEAFRRVAEDLGREVGRRIGKEEVVNPERKSGEDVVGMVDDGHDDDDDDD